MMLRRLYAVSPEFIKKTLRFVRSSFMPFPYDRGFEFARVYKKLMESQWYTREKLKEMQLLRLKDLLEHAYVNVPYYKRIFDDRGLKPSDIQSLEDLTKLPILTKDTVRQHFNELVARNADNFCPQLSHTTGSTQEPISYYLDRRLRIMTSACVQRHWSWCGVNPNELIVVLRGTLIDEFGERKKLLWRLLGNELHLSTFEMSDEVMAEYIKLLFTYRPSLIRGYPSSLEILARFALENRLSMPNPRAIHTSSEVILPEQRKCIEMAFGAPLFDWYGHGESTVNAGECDHHKGLHVGLEYGYTEFIKTPETQNMDGVYNIVSTSLWNYSMPLIRYDTEDLALLGSEECTCGRGLPLIKAIIGRRADIIEGVNGVKVGPSSFVHFWKYRIAEYLHGVNYIQIVQTAKDFIVIRLVGKKSLANEKIIVEQVRQLLGNMRIEFEYLSEVPTGQKWRFTVSEITSR